MTSEQINQLPRIPPKHLKNGCYARADALEAHLNAALAKIAMWKANCTGRHDSQAVCVDSCSGETPVQPDELEQLRRIDRAARAFVDNFPSTYVDDGNCHKEWRELNEALFDGRPAQETKAPHCIADGCWLERNKKPLENV